MRSTFLLVRCIMRRKFPICISILSASFLFIHSPLQSFFYQGAVFNNAETFYALRIDRKFIITIPTIILTGSHSAHGSAFAKWTMYQSAHILFCYSLRKSCNYTNTFFRLIFHANFIHDMIRIVFQERYGFIHFIRQDLHQIK